VDRDPTRPPRGPSRIYAGLMCGWGANARCP
jgi:hypothetical protein